MAGPLSRETQSKLLSVLLQVALDGRELVWVSRTKSPVLIDIDQARVLKMKNHIGMMVTIHINETQRDWDQVIAIPIELWPAIDVIYPINLAVSQETCHAARRFQRMGFLA